MTRWGMGVTSGPYNTIFPLDFFDYFRVAACLEGPVAFSSLNCLIEKPIKKRTNNTHFNHYCCLQNCVFSVHLEPEVSISVTNQRKYIFLLSCNGRFVVLECYFSISMNTKVENVCGHQIVMNVFRNRLHLDRSGDCLRPNSKKIKKIKKTPGFHSFLFQTCHSRMTAELIHVTLFWTNHPTCFANSVFFNEGQCEHNKHYAHIGLFHDVPG